MNFYVVEDYRTDSRKISTDKEYCVLKWDDWNDFGYKTQFHLRYVKNGEVTDLGAVKIAFLDDTQNIYHFNQHVPKKFSKLNEKFFSIGGSGKYYKRMSSLNDKTRKTILKGLNDLAFAIDKFNQIYDKNLSVLNTSLLREFFVDEIRGKYNRLAHGKPELTEFSFSFEYFNDENRNVEVSFDVTPNSLPPTNLHVVIGSNGVGKTNFLNKILKKFFNEDLGLTKVIYFSYSPFDKPFQGIVEEDIADYDYAFYGLLKSPFNNTENTLNGGSDLEHQFLESFEECMKSISKTQRWIEMLKILIKNDDYLSNLFSYILEDEESEINNEKIIDVYRLLSTGHKIVIKSLTHLVNSVTEKSLILYDEPETYLHPPLISAYLRAMSWLLIDRNAIGILTTHSPIILQEIPKSCVWKILRRGDIFNALRLETETFGENISLLNYEIFNLTASNSSFIDLLEAEVRKIIKDDYKKTNIEIFNQVIHIFNEELGTEARAHLMKSIKNIKSEIKDEKN